MPLNMLILYPVALLSHLPCFVWFHWPFWDFQIDAPFNWKSRYFSKPYASCCLLLLNCPGQYLQQDIKEGSSASASLQGECLPTYLWGTMWVSRLVCVQVQAAECPPPTVLPTAPEQLLDQSLWISLQRLLTSLSAFWLLGPPEPPPFFPWLPSLDPAAVGSLAWSLLWSSWGTLWPGVIKDVWGLFLLLSYLISVFIVLKAVREI